MFLNLLGDAKKDQGSGQSPREAIQAAKKVCCHQMIAAFEAKNPEMLSDAMERFFSAMAHEKELNSMNSENGEMKIY